MVSQMQKAVITVIGKDTVGIIARVCTYLADTNVNIIDINQGLTGGFFNMFMIVDASKATVSFTDLQDGLEQVGEALGVEIRCQREEIFEMMHRI